MSKILESLCCGMCTPAKWLSQEEMVEVDKALGNLKNSHKSITFTGLINISSAKATMLHYFAPTESSFCQIHADSYSKENKDASVQAKIREG